MIWSAIFCHRKQTSHNSHLGGKAFCTEYCIIIQAYINKLRYRSEIWQTFLNVEKCKFMYVGDQNPNFEYQVKKVHVETFVSSEADTS